MSERRALYRVYDMSAKALSADMSAERYILEDMGAARASWMRRKRAQGAMCIRACFLHTEFFRLTRTSTPQCVTKALPGARSIHGVTFIQADALDMIAKKRYDIDSDRFTDCKQYVYFSLCLTPYLISCMIHG